MSSITDNRLWEKLWETINFGLILVDAKGMVLMWNGWVAKHSGIPAEFAIGHSLESLFPDGLDTSFRTAIRNALSHRLPIILSNALHRSPLPLFSLPLTHQAQVRIEQSIALTPISEGEDHFCLIQINDTSMSLKRERVLQLKSERLSKYATTDALTGLHNRRAFDERFRVEYARALRQNSPLSLVMLDVDYFKLYNDTYGHSAGDKVLVAVANAIKSQANRATDVVARYGGEEFIAILPNCESHGGLIIAEKFREAVAALNIVHEKSDVSGCVTISAGVATLEPGDTCTANDLLEKVDQSLYQAKHAGRNCVR